MWEDGAAASLLVRPEPSEESEVKKKKAAGTPDRNVGRFPWIRLIQSLLLLPLMIFSCCLWLFEHPSFCLHF